MMYVCGSGICGMESAMSGTRLFLVSYWYRPENICTARRRVGVALNRSGLSEATSLSSSMRKGGDVPVCAGAVGGAAAGAAGVQAASIVAALARLAEPSIRKQVRRVICCALAWVMLPVLSVF